jgi:hypothetical protein
MGMMAKTAKKSTEAKNAPVTTSVRPAAELTWKEEKAGEHWISSNVPEGERHPARIRRSSKNSDGSYSFFCYRDAQAIAVVHDLAQAKRACAKGKRRELSDSVIEYVEKHPREIPPFLLLTDGERRAVRAQYAYAAPAPTRTMLAMERRRGATDGGDDSDPGTRALRAELESEGRRSAATGKATVAKVPKRVKGEAAPSPQGRLERVKDTNPKKPGSGAWKRWEVLFEHCKKGNTVAAFQAASGNMDTLANAVRAGYVSIKGEK